MNSNAPFEKISQIYNLLEIIKKKSKSFNLSNTKNFYLW